VPNFINGFAGGFIFVPLTTMSMGRLRKQEIGNAAGIYNLARNVGGSIGIASMTTYLVRGAQTHQNYLAANLTASNPATMALLQGLQAKFHIAGADAFTAHQEALGALYVSVREQAAVLAYADNFRLLGYLSLLCIPPVLFLHRIHHGAQGQSRPEVSVE
jgi:DHA2 family multidrug resistance protein